MTVSGKIDSINRIRFGEEGRQTAKILELCADRVQKDQWWPVASLFVTQAKRIRYLQEVRFGFGRGWHLSSLLLHKKVGWLNKEARTATQLGAVAVPRQRTVVSLANRTHRTPVINI